MRLCIFMSAVSCISEPWLLCVSCFPTCVLTHFIETEHDFCIWLKKTPRWSNTHSPPASFTRTLKPPQGHVQPQQATREREKKTLLTYSKQKCVCVCVCVKFMHLKLSYTVNLLLAQDVVLFTVKHSKGKIKMAVSSNYIFIYCAWHGKRKKSAHIWHVQQWLCDLLLKA